MPTPLIRYRLDPTGVNPDNFVNGEVKTLATTQIRAIAPTYGPFFTETVAVFDHGNGRVLVRGVDYKIVDLLQTATLRFGKEIAQVILIINPAVGSQARVNYQVLGGEYQSSSESLINLYESFLADGRPVDWTEVLNKPTQYTPTLHRHFLEDIYGYEPVVVALERIRNAIVLSDVPAFEALIDWVKANAGSCVITDPMVPEVRRDEQKLISITTSNNKNGQQYFWSIEHVTTTDGLFRTLSGVFTIFQNRSTFKFLMGSTGPNRPKKFNVVIRKDRANGPVVTTIEGITFLRGSGADNTAIELMNACCIMNPRIYINPTSLYLAGE